MNKLIKLILFFLGILFLFFLIHRAGFNEIIKNLAGAKLPFLFLGTGTYLTLIFTRSFKWFFLTKKIKNKVEYKHFLPLYLVNSLMGNLTPFKSGETITPFLFRKFLNIPVGEGFSVIILDRIFELIIFTALLVIAVFYILILGIQNNLIVSFLKGVLACLALLLALLVTVVISKKITLKILKLFDFFKRYSFPKRGLEFIQKELDAFYDILPQFKNKKVCQIMIPLTLLGWFFEILASYLIFSSVLSVFFFDIAASQIIAMAATFITFIPGGLGIAEVSVTSVLSLIGYPFLLTVTGVLLIRLFLSGTLLITGLIGSLLLKEKSNYVF